MEILTKLHNRVRYGRENKPKYLEDEKGISIQQDLVLKHTKHKFVNIRTELIDQGNTTRMRLRIDGMVFKEWVVNNETKVVTKSLDYFGE